MIALLLAMDLCASVTDVAHSAPARFERVRGEKRKDEPKAVVWTDPVKVPGADACRIVDFKDGSPAFYVCEMAAAGPASVSASVG